MSAVLVTGGLGAIGSFVCRSLVEGGERPIVLSTGANSALIADIADRCVIERGDVADLPRVMEIVRRHEPRAIAHIAGKVGPAVEQLPWSAIQTNVIGTTTVFEAARACGVRRVVFPSSKQVYGPVLDPHRHPRYEPVPETHPLAPANLYAKIKCTCESFAEHYARLYAIDIIALRFGPAFAPGRLGRSYKVSPVPAMIEAAMDSRAFELAAGGEQCDNLCYSAESAGAILCALNAPLEPGRFAAYNVAAPDLLSIAQMADILRALYPDWKCTIGPGLDYRGLGVPNYFRMDTRKAQRELGYTPRYDFRTAALDYIATVRRLRSAAASG